MRAIREGAENTELLLGFGQDVLNEQMMMNAGRYLVKCVSNLEVETFDELRFMVYHEKHLTFDIERFPPTSDSIRQHIMRA